MSRDKKILPGFIKDLEASSTRSLTVRHLVLGPEEYVRGLRDAAVAVSQESIRRREIGEMEAYYALNTAWHAIQRLAEEASKASARQRPQTQPSDSKG